MDGVKEILRARGTMRTHALTPAQKEAITGFRSSDGRICKYLSSIFKF